jgi:transposase
MVCSTEARVITIVLRNVDGNVSECARLVERSRGVVTRCRDGTNKNLVGGRKRNKATHAKYSAIKKLALKTVKTNGQVHPAFGSSRAIAQRFRADTGSSISNRQVQRVLRDQGLKSFKRGHVPTRDKFQQQVRVAFAKKCLRTFGKHPHGDWIKIVFSDETYITSNEHAVGYQYASNRKEVLPLERKSKYNVACVMVWAAVGYNFKSDIVIFPAYRELPDGDTVAFRLNSTDYIKRCMGTVCNKLVKEKRLFQQDGAKCHANKKVWGYFARKKLRYVPDWPPHTPDANMIEFLWPMLKRRVADQCPNTMDELKAAIKQAWSSITQREINRLCLGFQRKLKKVVAQRV